MNMVVWEKLPPLTREGLGYSSPSPFRPNEHKKRKGAVMKDCQEDIFFYNNWPNPVQRRHDSPRRKIYSEHSEEKRNTLLAGSEMDSIFPLKPGCHRMPLNPSDCQADRDYFIQKDKTSLKEHSQHSEQTRNRRQDKYDQCKLEHFDSDYNDLPRESGETNVKSLNGYRVSHKGRLYENEMRLTKEIRKKEILLQEKLLKAAERMRQVQLRNAFEDKVKEEQRNTDRTENSLFYAEKGNWDWESTRGRALGGRRHEGKQEGFNNWVTGKDGKERQENHVKETHATQKEKSKKGIEREDRGRNTHRTTKTVEKEWDHFEEMTRQTQERARTERDKTRRQRAVQRWNNDMREWEQRDWQDKEILRAYDGEKRRRERLKLKKEVDIGDEDQKWDRMDKFALNSHIKGKSVSNHDKWNVLIKDHFAPQDRVHQYSHRAAEEMPLKQPLPEAGPSTQKGKRLLQEQLSQESNPDADFQLVRCEVCNRKFREDRLEKHISICQKTQKPKRQVFNSSQYRAKGTELEEFMKTNGQSKTPERKKSNWRQKHEAFVRNIRQARGPAVGGFKPSEDLNPDYVTCPHCSRRFAPGPAERHIPKCQYIKSRPPAPRQRQ
ncbi:hypothetical protein KOW79_008432 [Hemibagrus wyckioides]|uniref:C2HC/C3H-type domain-containing protein n=1 Tax=Hemibagrus wyckioides TaxID=337641 RepID=A0A9D3SR58_9TELE|nr:zinc finger C2HC domain-containing protein 1C-like isoform X2 [Hemibagrus wyckioides]XP_058254879.1 zinc finger C2HC domain-containing protein 1C-like isoform X2 [Hemibagrus wyckioides]KAG7328488.1 hypothetical protein KOW79_008432 [Hemibagrus wyckioides]